MLQFLNKINAAVWGAPTLLLIFFTGIILTLRTKFFQIKKFKQSAKIFFGSENTAVTGGRLSPLQSASTALSATMGVGNIVGVAGAISLGGAGAVFWMWVSAIFSMIVKFAEIALAVRYREQKSDGSYSGGAMYYMKNALPKIFYPLAIAFCVCGVAAAFGVGNMTQINTISASINQMARALFDISPRGEFWVKLSVGIICAAVCSAVLSHDKRIGSLCEKIIPALTFLYLFMTLGAILVNYKNIPSAFVAVFKGAFSPAGVTGGAVGSAFVGMRFGIARGSFSNEAGMGTAPTAYSCAEGDEISLGLMGVMEVFIDTVVVCTLTAFTILCSVDVKYGTDLSTTLTLDAFKSVYGDGVIFVFCPVVCFFAFSSVLGWGFYGTKFAAFLFGEKAKGVFLVFFILSMVPTAIFRAEVAWVFAEILNGLMILPNTAALLLLTNEIADITHGR